MNRSWMLIFAFIFGIAGCSQTNAIHAKISVDDVASVKLWGQSLPNGEQKIENPKGIGKIIEWFNAASDIRENKSFAGSTPQAGIIVELNTGETILILRSGEDFEVQRKGASYWAKQSDIKTLLDKLAS